MVTCRALRIHISQEIEQRVMATGQRRLREAGHNVDRDAVERLLGRIQERFFDDTDSPGRKALDRALEEIMRVRVRLLEAAQMSAEQREMLTDVMRRFLRVSTTLVRCFPIAVLESSKPGEAVATTLDQYRCLRCVVAPEI